MKEVFYIHNYHCDNHITHKRTHARAHTHAITSIVQTDLTLQIDSYMLACVHICTHHTPLTHMHSYHKHHKHHLNK